MKRLIPVLTFSLGLLIGSVAVLHAVNFTVDLTSAEIDIANWSWKAEHGGSSGQFATAALYGGNRVKNLIAEFKGRRQVFRIKLLGDPAGYFCTNTWPGLSQGTKDTICTGTLFDVNGCTPCSADGN